MEVPNVELIAKRESTVKVEASRGEISASKPQTAQINTPAAEPPSVTVQLSQEGVRLAKEASTLENANDSTDTSEKSDLVQLRQETSLTNEQATDSNETYGENLLENLE